MCLDLDQSATPTYEAPAAAPAGDGAAPAAPAAPGGEGKADQAPPAPAGQPAPAAPAKPDPDKVIELSRTARESQRVAKESKAQVTELEGRLKALQPVIDVMKLADSDPLAFIQEMADVVGLSPERVLQVMATKGAGGDPALSAEDRVALLERQLKELREGKAKPEEKPEDDKGAEARQGFLTALDAHIKAAPQDYPACADEPTAPEAAFILLARHWTEHGRAEDGSTKPGYQPMSYKQALDAVEKTLRAQAQRRAERIGLIKSTAAPAAAPSGQGGLSNGRVGPVVPASDRVLSDDEIRAEMRRAFEGR